MKPSEEFARLVGPRAVGRLSASVDAAGAHGILSLVVHSERGENPIHLVLRDGDYAQALADAINGVEVPAEPEATAEAVADESAG